MQIVTTETINGKELEHLAIVKGSSIQAVHLGKDIMAGFKTLVGGELNSYHEMMQSARAIAMERMEQEANALGADAIVGTRLTTSSILQSAAEVIVYGTAVKFK